VAIAVGIAFWFFGATGERSYEGHTAKYWFDILAAPQATVGKVAPDDPFKRRKAWDLLASRTNTIPFLMHEFVEADSIHARAYTWSYDHAPSVLHKVLPQPPYSARRLLASQLLHGNLAAAPYLANVLPQSSSATRSLALDLLRLWATTNYAPYAPQFSACLSDRNALVRSDALWLLTAIGPSASNAVPQLLQMLANTNKPIAPTAAYAVWKIAHRTNEGLPVLHAEFKKLAARHHVRFGSFAVVDWLLEMEPNSPPVIDYYRAWLQETNSGNRVEACAHIADRGVNARALLPDLWKLMDDPDLKVKQGALKAISAIEPKAHDNRSVDSP
jgi:hypothetical protein